MPRTIGIGIQDFEKIVRNGCFYVDKTKFIREWWESKDEATLITRPRRFGKTLNMSTLQCFFSAKYAGRGEELFAGLEVWENAALRAEQGKWPVLSLSFAGIKETGFALAKRRICHILTNLYADFPELRESPELAASDRAFFDLVKPDMDESDAGIALNQLSRMLERKSGKKVLIFLDEYDTPLQEAYLHGYWEEMSAFMRAFFNNTFKTNTALERAVITGITRVSKESMFSDLNNLAVVSTSSLSYADSFGFKEDEVFQAMDEFGLSNRQEVKDWYDGFTFGNVTDMYNPWSITNFLKQRKVASYWANTSSNSLISKLLRRGSRKMLEDFAALLSGGEIETVLDEQLAFSDLDRKADALWSLLLSGGYLKVLQIRGSLYRLALTNREILENFEDMVNAWFYSPGDGYREFQQALLSGDLRGMNAFLNEVALATVSSFDTGSKASAAQPEKFYHGFVLGLSIGLRDRYEIKSNHESGYGRYDVMLIPKRASDPAVIMEFKVLDKKSGESGLADTAKAALRQIEEKHYAKALLERGIAEKRIRKYGFAFRGKEVLILEGGAESA